MSEQEIRRQMVMQIGRVLANETCLKVIDALMECPRTPERLAADLRLETDAVTQALDALQSAGLLLRQAPDRGEVSLSPFGVYGARAAVNQVLATTHEDGQCGKCGLC